MNPDDFVQSANESYEEPKGPSVIVWGIGILVVVIVFTGIIWFLFFRGGDKSVDEGTVEDGIVDIEFESPSEIFTEDPLPTDKDRDGLTADEEAQYGTDDFEYDTDGDGLSDFDEVNDTKTDPNNPDTDGDGYWDGFEISNNFNPLGEGTL